MPKAPTFDELKDFTLKSYVKLLQYLKQIYNIVPFRKIPREDVPYIILRHDMDISLAAALKMARIEKDLGVRSTCFVLFSSRFYNVLEGNNVSILKQISRLGHEIGLHHHPTQYRLYNQNPKKTLKIEIQLLEHLLGKKVYSISRHGPWDRDSFATTKEYINANHPRFQRDIYIHDSLRAWTPLHGLFKLLTDPPRRVQLLIHPHWWQEDKLSRDALVERFSKNLEKKNLTFKKRFRKTWKTDPFVLEFDDFVRKGEFTQFREQEDGLNTKMQSKSRRILDYYDELFRWYMINTTFGWNIHKLRTIIQNKFQQLME